MNYFRLILFEVLLICGLAIGLGSGCDSKSSNSALPPGAAPKSPVDVTAVRAKADAGDAPAQAELGRLYAKGEGVTNSYKEAAKWFRLAAEKGNAEGQFGLGELCDAGQGVPKDSVEALKWYQLAAAQGNTGAQYNLGFIYESGRGVTQNQSEAAKWYRMAAEGGDPLAQYDIGQRYELGVGVKADRSEALKWFMLAVAQGQKDSIKRVDQIKSKMSREEIAEATRRVAAFSPGKNRLDSK
jgi:TPR repeat protein